MSTRRDRPAPNARSVGGRYVLYDPIAAGGMASVHFGRLLGPRGFARTVAIKQLHPSLAADHDVVAMLQEEACIAGRLHHPNVAATIDVVVEGTELYVVMEYVHGESLARIMLFGERAEPVAAPVASSILSGVLRGLHAAHEAKGEQGEPLEIVHRDVSPQNVLVGADGLARLIDFGIAKAADGPPSGGRRDRTDLKGKLAYLAPEQVRGEPATRQSDIYSAGVVLWEALTGRRLYRGDSHALVEQVLIGWADPPSKYVPHLPEAIDAIVLRALHARPSDRFGTAAEMADALELACPPVRAAEVAAWVTSIAGEALAKREELLYAIEAAERTRSAPAVGTSPRVSWRGIGTTAAVAALAAISAVVARSPAAASASLAAPPPAEPEAPSTGIVQESVDPAFAHDPPTPKAPAPSSTEAPRPTSIRPTSPMPHRAAAVERPGSANPHDECDPPYAVDALGIRIYKRACLHR